METEEILAMADIAEYIGQYTELTPKNGELWGLSPLKEENTPSFSVCPEKQRYYDFSSGSGGNLLDFIKAYHHCEFPRALCILRSYLGISDLDPAQPSTLECAKIARRFGKMEKPPNTTAHEKLSPHCMDAYEPDHPKLAAWESEGISRATMRQYDVRYDRFSDRIVYPIRNYDGDIVNISGRTLDPDYKAKGLRKYTYFKPWGGSMNTIYGVAENKNAILEKHEIILFEGAKSVMLAYEFGYPNAAAILTSHLSPGQLNYLIRLGVRVVFALDEDVDIRDDHNIEKLKHYTSVEWVRNIDHKLSAKMSPVDAGSDTWQYLYERRKPLR